MISASLETLIPDKGGYDESRQKTVLPNCIKALFGLLLIAAEAEGITSIGMTTNYDNGVLRIHGAEPGRDAELIRIARQGP